MMEPMTVADYGRVVAKAQQMEDARRDAEYRNRRVVAAQYSRTVKCRGCCQPMAPHLVAQGQTVCDAVCKRTARIRGAGQWEPGQGPAVLGSICNAEHADADADCPRGYIYCEAPKAHAFA